MDEQQRSAASRRPSLPMHEYRAGWQSDIRATSGFTIIATVLWEGVPGSRVGRGASKGFWSTLAIGVDSPHGLERVGMSGQAPDHLFGQSAEETERLRLQAEMFAPYTARLLADAGISPGMKVLDIGTGAGDVALLAADLVGKEGAVIGIDLNSALVETARARVVAARFDNVSFCRRGCGFGRAGA